MMCVMRGVVEDRLEHVPIRRHCAVGGGRAGSLECLCMCVGGGVGVGGQQVG